VVSGGRPHPDYLAASPHRRWTQPLAGLRRVLQAEASRLRGEWAWRILRHGAVVAMRLRADFWCELRISRRKAPEDDQAWALWEREVAIFTRELGIEGWQREDDPEASGVAVRFIERAQPAEEVAGDLFPELGPTPPSAIGL
jgi:hypothetical protein